ncbi:hypothetical protein LVJ82_16960 [Vitreoscilla massiliensis]|uniref:Uncharacterized protein n=1 Tax=Vitreoscilla massiliensis TaxID=1689272 RepID=A0ABY4DZZ1_9NEIS|nr:hypothetical protein [Vitreoscilla massiliensis]UOO89109.1 hypothetical protein LVJ82_16960 [Vitreoscilla massiliensis]
MSIDDLLLYAFVVWATFMAAQLLLASQGLIPKVKDIENKYLRRVVFVLLLPVILMLGFVFYAIEKVPVALKDLADGFYRVFSEVWGE